MLMYVMYIMLYTVCGSATVPLVLQYHSYHSISIHRTAVQLDRAVISLEVMVRSSAPQAPPTTLRAYFDSPG